MLSVSTLAYLDRGNQAALKDWAKSHADWHRQIQIAAVAQGKEPYDVYQLADIENLKKWTLYHEQEHVNIEASTGIPLNVDLSIWDHDDKAGFENWLIDHANVHQNIRTGLAI